ncbi:hypothetical protein F7734_04950 [Scytonema sp. UIC 10036]|uniref:hypothetical protein n=1 Tax=Scytonema sp. UIC 10036 TaxID=2304196 RepID=UPI0012DABF84|nr:hypothetical protein [Scytonema sp. UIC 10036]MUG91854.1 hypothetical protein [Scytonema sp. UIC 10036]
MILIIRTRVTPEQMEQMLEELKFYIKLAVEARVTRVELPIRIWRWLEKQTSWLSNFTCDRSK